MTITLELTEEQERSVLESAEHRDEDKMRQILAQALETVIDGLMRRPPAEADRDEFAALADRLVASFATSSGQWSPPEEALTREGIYGEHP